MPAIPDPKEKGLLTVAQAAEILEVDPRTIYTLIDEDKFPIIRVGRSIRIGTDKFLATFGLDQPGSAA